MLAVPSGPLRPLLDHEVRRSAVAVAGPQVGPHPKQSHPTCIVGRPRGLTEQSLKSGCRGKSLALAGRAGPRRIQLQ